MENGYVKIIDSELQLLLRDVPTQAIYCFLFSMIVLQFKYLSKAQTQKITLCINLKTGFEKREAHQET